MTALNSHAAASREWRSNAFWKFLDVGAANALRLLSTVVFARRLGLEGFGSYAFAVMIVSILVTVANLGLPTAASRFLAEARSREAPRDEVAGIVNTIVRLRIITWIPAVVLLCVGIAFLRTPLVPQAGKFQVVGILAAIFLAQSASVLLEYSAAGLGMYRSLVLQASLPREAVRLGGLILILVSPQPSAELALLVEGAVWVVMAICISRLIVRQVGFRPKVARVSSHETWWFARHAAPVTVLSLGSDWLGAALAVLVGGKSFLAVYTVAWRCVALVLTILPISGPALMPALAQLSASERQRFVREAFPRAMLITVAISALVGLGTVLLLPSVFGRAYAPAALLAIPLALTLPGRVLSPAMRQILLLHHRGWYATGSLVVGSICSTLIALLGRQMGTMGAAVGWGLVLGSVLELSINSVGIRSDGYQIPCATVCPTLALFFAVGLIAWAALVS